MTDAMRIFAGDCRVEFEGTRSRTQRGYVVILVKPDKTVLVHDADGYQPVAWLTRPESVTVEVDGDGFGITARADDQRLRVASVRRTGRADLPVSEAGVPVGRCPNCGDGDEAELGSGSGSESENGRRPRVENGTGGGSGSATGGALVRTGGDVVCLGCGDRYGLPSGARVLGDTCDDCGLPTLRVERGDAFEVCLDPGCQPLYEPVAERFDGVVDCPDCGADTEVARGRGGRLLLGCSRHPDCETAFSFPAGVVVGECDCGLPIFETARGRRCLDGTCEAFEEEGK